MLILLILLRQLLHCLQRLLHRHLHLGLVSSLALVHSDDGVFKLLLEFQVVLDADFIDCHVFEI